MKLLSTFQNKIKNVLSDKKKLRLSIGISLAIVIGMIVGSILIKPKENEILKNIYDLDKPIVVEAEKKYIYLSTSGDQLLDEAFLYASPFYGDYAAISRSEGKYEIIDKSGTTYLTADEQPKYYKDYGVWLVGNAIYDYQLKVLFEGDYKLSYIDDGFFLFLDNGNPKSGIVDFTGKKTFDLESDYINVSISRSEALCDTYGIVSNYEGLEYIINLKNGKIVFELEDTDTKYIRESADNIFKIIDRSNNYKTERWLYIEGDKIVFDTKEAIYDVSFYDLQNRVLKIDYGPGYASTGNKTRETYYMIRGKKFDVNYKADLKDANEIKIEKSYKISREQSGGMYHLYKNGSEILEYGYNNIMFLNFDLFKYLKETEKMEPVILSSGNTSYLYDIESGNTLKEFKTSHTESIDDSTFLLGTIYKSDRFTKDTYEVYNIVTNASLEIPASNQVKIYSNYITVTVGNKTTYYNSKLEIIRG